MRGPVQNFRRRRTKIKITRAVELRSSKFWKFWKAESTLLLLGTTFMGRNPLYPAEARASKKRTRSSHRISAELVCVCRVYIKENHSYRVPHYILPGGPLNRRYSPQNDCAKDKRSICAKVKNFKN